MSYVLCPATITSPAPSPGFMAATGLGPSEPCGCKCEVFRQAPAMDFICPRGHRFVAAPSDIRDEAVPS